MQACADTSWCYSFWSCWGFQKRRIEPSKLWNGSTHCVKEKTKARVWGWYKFKELNECTTFVFHVILQVRIHAAWILYIYVFLQCNMNSMFNIYYVSIINPNFACYGGVMSSNFAFYVGVMNSNSNIVNGYINLIL